MLSEIQNSGSQSDHLPFQKTWNASCADLTSTSMQPATYMLWFGSSRRSLDWGGLDWENSTVNQKIQNTEVSGVSVEIGKESKCCSWQSTAQTFRSLDKRRLLAEDGERPHTLGLKRNSEDCCVHQPWIQNYPTSLKLISFDKETPERSKYSSESLTTTWYEYPLVTCMNSVHHST